MLTVNQLSVTAYGARLLDQISFTLQLGEVLAILGPNGAGKTTLLNALMGSDVTTQMHWQQQGHIQFGHTTIDGFSSKQRAKQMALLPQLSSLSFPFTAKEVVELGRLPHETGVVIDQGIIEEALQWLDIKHLSERPYTQLSGGEKQRVQLARVMVQIWRQEDAEQRLLILDEPTSSLDLGHQQQLMKIVRRFSDQGVGVIMVAHDINLVSHYADHLLALNCGEVIAQGQPNQVITQELMKQLYQADVDIVSHPKTQKPLVMFGEESG